MWRQVKVDGNCLSKCTKLLRHKLKFYPYTQLGKSNVLNIVKKSRIVMLQRKCSMCGSDKLDHHVTSVSGQRGSLSTKSFVFDIYICKDCNYTVFFLKPKSKKKKEKRQRTYTSEQSKHISQVFKENLRSTL
jgi:hypothetical protein